ncbi:MAG: DEAD/DEAH box helicase [Myxococcota bacterium]
MSEGGAPRVLLSFDRGTLLLEPPEALDAPPEDFRPDPRAGGRLRAPAIAYRQAFGHLVRRGFDVADEARGYEELSLVSRREREPYPHQREALDAWTRTGRRGVVVLPTGAGKSYVAELAIASVQRSTLVVAPTIDLMTQWMNVLGAAFGEDHVGGVGGGMNDVRPLTCTTYDSAWIHMERLGDRFGLVVFDECHHLPGPSYAQGAQCSIAPFRLGLTATPERQDGSHDQLDTLIGPTIYRRDIQDLAGLYLADYEVVRLRVALTPDERRAYERARHEYRSFVRANGIRMSSPKGWGQFIMLSSQSRWGRSAWHAWREQKRVALQSEAKLGLLAELLRQHRGDQVLVFTADNDTVYAISRRHLIPAITHQTPAAERKAVLKGFNEGRLPAIVTSKVLNEGVDMPAASVGIVLSGSASVREHVQRLGRILRRQEGKSALLYEVVTADTGEEHMSERRREHGAYR